MGVNSVFKRFVNDRMMMSYCMIIAISFCFSDGFASGGNTCKPASGTDGTETPLLAGRDLRAKQVNLLIRQIGHLLLLQAGDSTFRVLPVREIKEGTFLLEFEKEFIFDHDSLVSLTQRFLPRTQFPSGYTLTVHECLSSSIVYGFQINNNSSDNIACRGRREAPGCYNIEIDFPDLYASVDLSKAEIIHQEQRLANVKLHDANAIPEELKATVSESNLAEELKPFETDHNVSPKLQEFKATTSDYSLTTLVYSGMLVLLSVGLLIGRFGKNLRPLPVQHQAKAVAQEAALEFPALGKFLFDVKGQRLLLGGEIISLTDKECKVLELLNANFGELTPRETLMQEVWINEGVITGRSLDMFVSRLRKKLSADPELKITNVHGKGYRLGAG